MGVYVRVGEDDAVMTYEGEIYHDFVWYGARAWTPRVGRLLSVSFVFLRV